MMDGFPEVNVTKEGYCLTDTGRLCGSTMPVLKGIKNLVENLGIGMKYAIQMASRNPAKVYGYPSKGMIAKGMDGDVIIIDDDYNCLYTFSQGRKVYDRSLEGDVFNPLFLKRNRC